MYALFLTLKPVSMYLGTKKAKVKKLLSKSKKENYLQITINVEKAVMLFEPFLKDDKHV